MKYFLVSSPTCNQEQAILDYLAPYIAGGNSFYTVAVPTTCSDEFYAKLVQTIGPHDRRKVEELDGTMIFCPPGVNDRDSKRRAYVEGAILESFFDSTFSITNSKLIVAPSNAVKYIISRIMKIPIEKYHLLDIRPGSLSVFSIDEFRNVKVFAIGSMKHLSVSSD